MRIRLLLVCLLILFGFAIIDGRGGENGPPSAEKPKSERGDPPAAHRGVAKDMPAFKVIELLGQPRKVARQILFRSHVEQWTYEEPIGLRIELHGVRGQEAHVVSVHSLRSKKP